MNSSEKEGIPLTIVTYEDIYLSLTKLRDGWGDAYQDRGAVVYLSPADIKKLNLRYDSKVELSNSIGSVVVAVRPNATSEEEGVGLMPSSLYTNRLASYDSGSPMLPAKYITVRATPTDKQITPISDVIIRRKVA